MVLFCVLVAWAFDCVWMLLGGVIIVIIIYANDYRLTYGSKANKQQTRQGNYQKNSKVEVSSWEQLDLIERHRVRNGFLSGYSKYCRICHTYEPLRYDYLIDRCYDENNHDYFKKNSDYFDGMCMCDSCYKQYKRDLTSGWSAPAGFDVAGRLRVWGLQRIVANDYEKHLITEQVARKEMDEAVRVAKSEIAAIKGRLDKQKADREREVAKQQRASETLRNLSSK